MNENEYCYTDYFYARYIDGAMNNEEKIAFEEHLLECDKCLKIVNQAFSDLYLLAKGPLMELPKELLEKARAYNYTKQNVLVAVIKKVKKSLKVLSHNFYKTELIPALQFKGKSHGQGVKLDGKNFNIQVHCGSMYCHLDIFFNNNENHKVSLTDQHGNLIGAFHSQNNEVNFKKINFGTYTLSFANKKIRIELK